MRILVRDPRETTEFQRSRILASLAHIERFAITAYSADIEVRCYKAAPALRGRLFDEKYIMLGWYTPDLRKDGAEGGMEIMGHCNPMIMSSTATEDGQRLKDFFDEMFLALWASGATNPALDILHSIDKNDTGSTCARSRADNPINSNNDGGSDESATKTSIIQNE